MTERLPSPRELKEAAAERAAEEERQRLAEQEPQDRARREGLEAKLKEARLEQREARSNLEAEEERLEESRRRRDAAADHHQRSVRRAESLESDLRNAGVGEEAADEQ